MLDMLASALVDAACGDSHAGSAVGKSSTAQVWRIAVDPNDSYRMFDGQRGCRLCGRRGRPQCVQQLFLRFRGGKSAWSFRSPTPYKGLFRATVDSSVQSGEGTADEFVAEELIVGYINPIHSQAGGHDELGADRAIDHLV